jgi:hypothetical protein
LTDATGSTTNCDFDHILCFEKERIKEMVLKIMNLSIFVFIFPFYIGEIVFPDPLVMFVTEKREKKVGVATRKKE